MAIDNALKMKLKGMGGAWDQAKADPKAAGFATVPDGTYIVALTAAEVNESQNGRLQIKWEYAIVDGEHAGMSINRYDGLDRPENLPYVIRELARYGVDFAAMKPEDLPSVLESLVMLRPQLQVRCKTNGDFQNVYTNKVLTMSEAEDVASTVTP